MIIDKAIELNNDTLKSLREFSSFDRVIAFELGIEALERVVNSRSMNPLLPDEPLLGETEE